VRKKSATSRDRNVVDRHAPEMASTSTTTVPDAKARPVKEKRQKDAERREREGTKRGRTGHQEAEVDDKEEQEPKKQKESGNSGGKCGFEFDVCGS